MSANRRQHYKDTLKRCGHWAGVRYMRNQGVPFEVAYEIAHGRPVPAKYL